MSESHHRLPPKVERGNAICWCLLSNPFYMPGKDSCPKQSEMLIFRSNAPHHNLLQRPVVQLHPQGKHVSSIMCATT